MNFLIVPEAVSVKVTLDLAPDVLKLLNRIVDLKEQPAKLTALAIRLNSARTKLESVMSANPDPDKTD